MVLGFLFELIRFATAPGDLGTADTQLSVNVLPEPHVDFLHQMMSLSVMLFRV